MRIALSQRVEQVQSYAETRDCLDRRWYDLMTTYGHHGIAVPNTPDITEDWCEQYDIEGIILTGGNDIAGQASATNISVERDETERCLLNYAIINNLPVLGVCRGLQFLNLELGGNSTRVEGHIATKHKVQVLKNPFTQITTATVNSYHGYGIHKDGISKELNAWCFSEDDMIEAVYHSKHNWIGIMWHPERDKSELDACVINHLFTKEA